MGLLPQLARGLALLAQWYLSEGAASWAAVRRSGNPRTLTSRNSRSSSSTSPRRTKPSVNRLPIDLPTAASGMDVAGPFPLSSGSSLPFSTLRHGRAEGSVIQDDTGH